MSKGNESAAFAFNFEGNAEEVAARTAGAMADLKARVAGSTASIRDLNATMKNLKGSSEEVTKARADLKAKIVDEQQAITKLTLKEIEARAKVDQLAIAEKKLAAAKKIGEDRTKALGAAMSTAGGPVGELRAKFDTLKAVLGAEGAGGKLALFTLGAGLAVAAVVALAAAVVASLASLGSFVLKSADAARSMSLLREAAVGGNAQWGNNFGEQVDALSKKVPTSRAEIDKLGLSLSKANIGGKTWVDSLNAITQASAAMGDEAGAKLKTFIDRAMILGKPGMFHISPAELIGTGVAFEDVAKKLAESMGTSVEKAKIALNGGRVKLADGAAALRAAVEKKLGGINLRQMLSLEVMAKKFGETLEDLTKNVDLEPLLLSLKDLASVFDLNQVGGQALKQIVEVFGKDLVGSFSAGTPLAKKFIYGLILGAQEITIGYLKVRNALREVFAGTTLNNAVLFKVAIDSAKAAAWAFIAPLALLAAQLALVAVTIAETASAIDAAANWGESIVNGMIKGISSGAERLKKAVTGLANDVKSAFTGALQIKSPSKVFEGYGGNIAEGTARGVEGGSGDAQAAVERMISPPSGGGGGGASASTINVAITINASGGNGREVGAQIASTSTIEAITKAIVDALHSAGVAVPS